MRSNGSFAGANRICLGTVRLGTILGFDPSAGWESILDR